MAVVRVGIVDSRGWRLLQERDEHDLAHLGDHTVPCAVHGQDRVALFTARTSATDAEVECHEGRQIVFVAPTVVPALDLTDATRALFPTVLSAHAD